MFLYFIDKPNQRYNPSRSLIARLGDIYRISGLSGIFAGLGPRLFKVAPACAIMISTFEYSKAFFYHYNIILYKEQVGIPANRKIPK